MGGGTGPEQRLGPAPDTLATAGPWLRYQNTEGGIWRGSVLFLTREAAGGGGGSGSAAPPSLTLVDGFRDGDAAVSPEERTQLLPVKLDAADGWAFWRFDLEFRLTPFQRSVQYQVEAGGSSVPTYTFWLPAIDQPMHFGYYSCNGFSSNVKPTAPERQDPTYLWRDLLSVHSAFPMHALVGGGDQLYNDLVFKKEGSPALAAWGEIDSYDEKIKKEWSPVMQEEVTRAYLNNYITCFMVPEVLTAFACIPQIMMWDDHDIVDGWGSYEPEIQSCPVMLSTFKVARRFYLLFQHHTTDEFNAKAQEFLLNDGSDFHFLKYMGPQVLLLGVDMRSQRTKERILPQSTYDLLERTVAALPEGPQHIVVLCGCPLIFPAIPTAEAILGGVLWMVKNSPTMRKLFRKTGLLDRYDQPEILDDLVDGWAADIHKEERVQFIHMLQRFSTDKHLRVTILSGDAHVGGVGRLYSRPKAPTLADDPLYMPQIISSAIMNGPPGHNIVRMLLRTNFATNVDGKTRQKMVRTFYPNHPRTDKLINARNWCDISLVAPPFSPPTVPGDPNFGGLRFVLRVENALKRKGRAEETYTVIAPRHPAAARATVATGSLGQKNGAKIDAAVAVAAVSVAARPELELPAAPGRG